MDRDLDYGLHIGTQVDCIVQIARYLIQFRRKICFLKQFWHPRIQQCRNNLFVYGLPMVFTSLHAQFLNAVRHYSIQRRISPASRMTFGTSLVFHIHPGKSCLQLTKPPHLARIASSIELFRLTQRPARIRPYRCRAFLLVWPDQSCTPSMFRVQRWLSDGCHKPINLKRKGIVRGNLRSMIVWKQDGHLQRLTVTGLGRYRTHSPLGG